MCPDLSISLVTRKVIHFKHNTQLGNTKVGRMTFLLQLSLKLPGPCLYVEAYVNIRQSSELNSSVRKVFPPNLPLFYS